MVKIIKFCFISYTLAFLFSCSDSVTESQVDDGTQFPAKGPYEGTYWPTDEWRHCTPEEVGIDSDLLMAAYDFAVIPDLETSAILIIKDGYIIGEAYFDGAAYNSQLQGYSFAKSFTSAVTGIVIDQGLINSVEDFAYNYLPEWNLPNVPELKKKITIKHLLTMTAGISWNRDSTYVDDFEMTAYSNYLNYVLYRDVLYEPGTQWFYSNGEAMLMSGILQKATDMRIDIFANQTLFGKIGIPFIKWSADLAGHTNTAWGIRGMAREYAKLGYLYLKYGKWDNEQIISEFWIRESIKPVSDEINHYGYYWWLPPAFDNYTQYNIPANTYLAVGAYGQRMYIVPEENLLIVRLGQSAGTNEIPWDTMRFLSLVLESIRE